MERVVLNITRLVSFDLDDTLIRGIHSVLLPCILNGKEKECVAIDEKEAAGALDYISADYLKAELFEGLPITRIAESFLDIAHPLDDIKNVVDVLHQKDTLCIVITVGPIQVAKAVCDIYGFDDCYGSEYEEADGLFTGRISNYLSAENKVECLRDICRRYDVVPDDCIAVGDGATDIPVFEYCGKSIAINASAYVQSKATYSVDTQNLTDILCFL